MALTNRRQESCFPVLECGGGDVCPKYHNFLGVWCREVTRFLKFHLKGARK